MDIAKIASDFGISTDEVRLRWLTMKAAQWKSNFPLFAKECLRIRAKDGDLSPLVLNDAQAYLHSQVEEQLKEARWARIIGCKSRRQGFSTYTMARGFWKASLWPRQRAYILSHEMTSSNTLFDMVKLMLEKHPFPPKTGTDNAKALEFSQSGSSFTVATAGQKAGGRGGAVSYFAGSEVAYWASAEDHFASSVQSVDEVRGVWGILWQEPASPLPFERGKGQIEGWIKAPSETILESTSAGPSGVFWKRYMEAMKGEGRYRHVFVAWFRSSEYAEAGDFIPRQEPEEEGELSEAEYQQLFGLSNAQMLWRRSKIHELGSLGKFKNEYPADINEAFAATDVDSFIKPVLCLRARKRKIDMPDAPLIIGVDPAGAGGDRFAVAFRRGDLCFRIEQRLKLEHDDAVAWIANIIDEWNPDRVCIDRGSMGGNIISSLRNLKKRYFDVIKGVDFGGTSKFKKATPNRAGPWNMRAEMYSRMRDWLMEGGCIPDDDDLVSDLSAPRIKYRANNDFLLESKSDLKARGIRSTDLSDALCLTFSVAEFFDSWNKPKPVKGFAVGEPENNFVSDQPFDDFSGHDPLAGVDYGWMS